MNNFYCNLPDGFYRELYEDDSDREELFDTIDRLLETEFVGIDAKAIYVTIRDANRLFAETLNGSRDSSILEAQINIIKGASDKISPLYKKLIEIGYDEEFLRT